MTALISAQIEKSVLSLSDLNVEFVNNETKFKNRAAADRAMRVVMPDGRKLRTSDKFWVTFCQNVGISRNIFDYFSYQEVFNRISSKNTNKVRLSFEKNEDENSSDSQGRLLTCTNPKRPILQVEEVNNLITEYGGDKVNYADGVIGASFECPFPMTFNIVGKQDSDFSTRFYMAMPVDGYGLPAAYLELLRKVCANGAVAMSRAFRTSFTLGKDDANIASILERAMESFNNEEGFHAYKDRIDAASKSWASLYDMINLSKSITAGAAAENWGIKERYTVLNKLDEVCGSPLSTYGMIDANEYSKRVTKTLPVKATMYDLINFASELSTHNFATFHGRRKLNAWIGDSVMQEYNLENSVETYPEFSDFFLNTPAVVARKDAARQV